jgi:integrative and conjugative element protein (TIGR02256 family)
MILHGENSGDWMLMQGASRVLTYARAGGARFQISASAVDILRAHVQHEQTAPEAGGVLLGRHIIGTAEVIVDSVTTPMPGDKAHRVRFFRSRRAHQEAVDRAWDESKGTRTYLGGWHTHPEPVPTPSGIDWVDWRRHLLVDRYTGSLFFVIVGTREIRVWEGRRCARLSPLILLPED